MYSLSLSIINMTLKEKAIEAAYGFLYKDYKDFINNNGWTEIEEDILGFQFCSDDVEYLNFNMSNLWRPKSLRGLENNNGWIKIESDADLPKEVIDCWFLLADGSIYLGHYTTRGYFCNGGDDIEINIVTHYQPIVKPLNPIY